MTVTAAWICLSLLTSQFTVFLYLTQTDKHDSDAAGRRALATMRRFCLLLGFAALSTTTEATSLDWSRFQVQDQQARFNYDGNNLIIPTSALDRPRPIFPHAPGRLPSGFIALGDSYSAGIGTGFNGTEDPCRTGLHAHPVLLHHDLLDVADPDESSFQFLSCTGSTVKDVLLGSERSQIGEFNTTTTADFALLSVGGNDLGFFDIMNGCIFRFYSFYSGTCEEALEKSEAAITGPQFETTLRLAITEILDRVHWEKRPWFTITVTGYARFFNSETEACDDSSFGIWWRGPKLKRELRQRMNQMVLAVNAKIKRSIEAVNSEYATTKVYFVDYDHLFEGHRFCEEGVIEPDYKRNDTWFFLVGGHDNADSLGDDVQLEALQRPVPSDSPLRDPDACMEIAMSSGDWGERAICYMAMAVEQDPTLRLASGDEVSTQDMWYVPTYYGQTFHPVGISCPHSSKFVSLVCTMLIWKLLKRTKGHEAIRDQIYRRWREVLDQGE